MNVFQAQIDLTGISLDQIQSQPDFKSSEGKLYPEDDFVISHTKNCGVLSRYGDNIWDLSPYRGITMNSGRILFDTWYSEADELARDITEQLKKLMFCIIYKS